eukprot:2328508-Amphidinium_carterae.1
MSLIPKFYDLLTPDRSNRLYKISSAEPLGTGSRDHRDVRYFSRPGGSSDTSTTTTTTQRTQA